MQHTGFFALFLGVIYLKINADCRFDDTEELFQQCLDQCNNHQEVIEVDYSVILIKIVIHGNFVTLPRVSIDFWITILSLLRYSMKLITISTAFKFILQLQGSLYHTWGLFTSKLMQNIGLLNLIFLVSSNHF